LNQGLEAAWLLQDKNTVWTQDLRKRFNGFYQGGPTVGSAGPWGQAIVFDGAARYIDCGLGPTLSRFSVGIWFKPTAFTNFGTLICMGTGAARNYCLDTKQTTGELRFTFTTGAFNYKTVTGATVPTLNLWHFGCLTFDGTTQRIYLDGILDGSLANTAPDVTTGLEIGADAGNDLFIGSISEVRIWNRALSQTEIRLVMNSNYEEFFNPNRNFVTRTPIVVSGTSNAAVTVIG
jgi:hypothetical protein